MDIGGYAAERSPDRPILVHMVRTPLPAGAIWSMIKTVLDASNCSATSFETFERKVREQLGRALAEGGFDPVRDIIGITVNRWPHGYAPEFNPLW